MVGYRNVLGLGVYKWKMALDTPKEEIFTGKIAIY